jgi:hypothetical protein
MTKRKWLTKQAQCCSFSLLQLYCYYTPHGNVLVLTTTSNWKSLTCSVSTGASSLLQDRYVRLGKITSVMITSHSVYTTECRKGLSRTTPNMLFWHSLQDPSSLKSDWKMWHNSWTSQISENPWRRMMSFTLQSEPGDCCSHLQVSVCRLLICHSASCTGYYHVIISDV